MTENAIHTFMHRALEFVLSFMYHASELVSVV